MQYGLSKYSAVGLGFMALSFAGVLQNTAEGYTLGKLARSLNESPKVIPDVQVELYVLGMVNIWKIPIQSVLQPLLYSHKMAMRVGHCGFLSVVIILYSNFCTHSKKAGDVSSACIAASLYLHRSFFSGSSLSSLSTETAAFLRLMVCMTSLRVSCILTSNQ